MFLDLIEIMRIDHLRDCINEQFTITVSTYLVLNF